MNVEYIEEIFMKKLKKGENLQFFICDSYCLDLSGALEVVTDSEFCEKTEIEVYSGINPVFGQNETHDMLGKIIVSPSGHIISFELF